MTATDKTSIDLLWHWCREGWKYRGLNERLTPRERKEYGERVKYEMGLIIDKDFVDYFLVLSDVVRTAKDLGVAVGPARGSAAASLVCYLIRLTEVNPLDYPLMLFERFIDPNRNDLPDIDLDFEDDRRDEVRQIMIRKYGADRVGNIGTFTRYRGKNAIDDVARVYQLPKGEVDGAKEFLVERSGGDSRFDASIEDTVEMFPQVKEVFDKYPELYHTLELEGNYKSFGVHAAGLVVGAEPLWKYVATYGKNNVGKQRNSVQVLSVDKYDGEHLGLMKLDALGLQTMGMIRIALDMLGMSLVQLYDIPMDDPKMLAGFKAADVVGIFQFEGRTMKMVTEQMKPETFMDLAAVNALARPGPLHSGSTGDYLATRAGQLEHVALHPIVERICAATEGQIIYQEQILQICREIGKFPWTHASKIRKIISNKTGESAFNAMWGDFLEGAMQEPDMTEEVARDIWKRMATAGTYAFNIAHCVSYSMLGAWAMWLKQNHPVQFYAAQLQKTDDEAKATLLMRDMMNPKFGRDLKVYAPDPAESGRTWRAVEGGVRAGYMQIPGIGERTADSIDEYVKDELGGHLESWEQMGRIKGIGPKTIEKIMEFSLNPDPFGIEQLDTEINLIKEMIRNGELPGVPYPKDNSDDIPYEAVKSRHTIIARIKSRNLKDHFEDYRSRTGEELDPSTLRSPELKDSMALYLEDQYGMITLKVDRFLYPKVKAELWMAKLNKDYLVFTAEKFPFSGKSIRAQNIWVIDPD